MRTAVIICALLIAVGACAQQAVVHLRGADGSWTQLAAQTEGEVIRFTIGPEQAPGGRALVVINKPEWMVLEDEQAPRVLQVTVGERELAPGEEGAVELGQLPAGTVRLTVKVADDANPVDPASVSVVGAGSGLKVQVVESDLPRAAGEGTVTLLIENLQPGVYRPLLRVADMSPQRNTALVPLPMSVYGLGVAPDGQSVRLAGAGKTYEIGPEGMKFLSIGEGGPSLYLSTQIHGQFYYVNGFAAIEQWSEAEGLVGATLRAHLMDIDKKPVTNQQAGLELSFNVGLVPDLGCLLITGHARNLGEASDVYCFWGWVPGSGYVTPDGERHAWSMSYRDLGELGWVFLPSQQEGRPGVGWIGPGIFGESRFGTMIQYTNPKYIKTPSGGEVTTHLAVMPAGSAEEVAAVAEKLEALGWPERFGPK